MKIGKSLRNLKPSTKHLWWKSRIYSKNNRATEMNN